MPQSLITFPAPFRIPAFFLTTPTPPKKGSWNFKSFPEKLSKVLHDEVDDGVGVLHRRQSGITPDENFSRRSDVEAKANEWTFLRACGGVRAFIAFHSCEKHEKHFQSTRKSHSNRTRFCRSRKTKCLWKKVLPIRWTLEKEIKSWRRHERKKFVKQLAVIKERFLVALLRFWAPN